MVSLQAEKLLSKKEVRQILNCSTKSVARYASCGQIPASVRLSGSVKWKLSDITLFLECDCDMAKFQARRDTEKC